MTPYFYDQVDGLFEPTHLARSPWERGKQNGVALGGLAAFLIETVPSLVSMTTARLAIDIFGAAPLGPTEGRTRVLREGKRIQIVEVELLVEGVSVARATAMRVRVEATPRFGPTLSYPPPEDLEPVGFLDPRAFGGTMETRAVSGELRKPGRAALWVNFGHEHVAGTPLSPLLRVASIADFGGGLGAELSRDEWNYMNLDISVHMVREPEGEWLLVDAETESAGLGLARSDMVIADRHGPFARAHQALFISPRPA